MLSVVTYSQTTQTTLRNTCRTHDEAVVRQLGRVALFNETELAAFLTPRLREEHDEDVQIEQTQSFNESAAVPDTVCETAATYEDRRPPIMPCSKFASGTNHLSAAEVQRREL